MTTRDDSRKLHATRFVEHFVGQDLSLIHISNDLEAAITWWKEQKIEIWGVIPERVGIAAGPERRLSREGVEGYDSVLHQALRGWR